MKHPLTENMKVITYIIKLLTRVEVSALVESYSKQLQFEIDHKGVVHAVKYYKQLYTLAIHIACGQPITPIKWRRCDNEGICTDLSPYIFLLRGTTGEKRAGLSILRLVYLIHSSPEVDLKTVSSPQTSNWSDIEWVAFESWLSSSQIKSNLPFRKLNDLQKMLAKAILPPTKGDYVMPRASAGPNGSSSLYTSHRDALALIQNAELLSSLDFLLPGCKDWVTNLAEWYLKEGDGSTKTHKSGKLVGISEGGCKTRTIAIADLFTQTALRPLHEHAMHRLKSLDQDGTWNQSKIIERVTSFTARSGYMYSLDLTAATDRFPLELQKLVVKTIYGSDYSFHWANVMSLSRSFWLSPKHPDVKYSVGQPMGIFSSWPVFALSHHILVKYAAHLVGLPTFRDYVLLGDDIMIRSKRVTMKYLDLMARLGVDISEEKSLMSQTKPHCGEICKAILYNGIDLSPIPPKLLVNSGKSEVILTQLFTWSLTRYNFNESHLKEITVELPKIYSHRHKKNRCVVLLNYLAALKATTGSVSTPLRFNITDIHPAAEFSPWVKALNGYTLSDAVNVVKHLRYVSAYKKYCTVLDSWMGHPVLQHDGLSLPKEENNPGLLHPVQKARSYVVNALKDHAILTHESSVLDYNTSDLGDFDVGRLIDPTLRDYASRSMKVNKDSAKTVLSALSCFIKGRLPDVADVSGGPYLFTDPQSLESEINRQQEALWDFHSLMSIATNSPEFLTRYTIPQKYLIRLNFFVERSTKIQRMKQLKANANSTAPLTERQQSAAEETQDKQVFQDSLTSVVKAL